MILNVEETDVNCAADRGVTPLHVAAELGLHDVAKILLENGANVNSTASDGITPIFLGLSSSQAVRFVKGLTIY